MNLSMCSNNPQQMSVPSESDTDESYSSLRSVTRGASVFFLGTGFSRAFGFCSICWCLVLGVGLYGVYSYGHTLVTIASGFALLGTDKSILKFIPQCEDDRSEQNRVLGLVSLTALAGGVVIGAVIYTLAPIITEVTLENPLLTDVLRVFAFFVLLQTLSTSWVVCSRVLNFRRIGWGF